MPLAGPLPVPVRARTAACGMMRRSPHPAGRRPPGPCGQHGAWRRSWSRHARCVLGYFCRGAVYGGCVWGLRGGRDGEGWKQSGMKGVRRGAPRGPCRRRQVRIQRNDWGRGKTGRLRAPSRRHVGTQRVRAKKVLFGPSPCGWGLGRVESGDLEDYNVVHDTVILHD